MRDAAIAAAILAALLVLGAVLADRKKKKP